LEGSLFLSLTQIAKDLPENTDSIGLAGINAGQQRGLIVTVGVPVRHLPVPNQWEHTSQKAQHLRGIDGGEPLGEREGFIRDSRI
jgi:hypothetical protein